MSLGSILGKLGKGAASFVTSGGNPMAALSSVLGGAAKGSTDTSTAQVGGKLAYDKFNMDAPATKAKRALAAALAQNYSPTAVQWGGPGSGLRGEMPKFTGGMNDAMPAAMSDPLVMELMGQVKAGKDANYQSGLKSSVLDKILGVGGLATGALGAIFGKKGK